MIDKKQIEQLVLERIEGTDIYIVDIKISTSNQILVEIDNAKRGISVEECISVSRNVEHNLDREVEDFELTVTSPGADQPYKVIPQYLKNIGREVKTTFKDGKTLQGELISVTENEIEIKTKQKERIEGRKAKQWVEELHKIDFKEIKETKTIIKF